MVVVTLWVKNDGICEYVSVYGFVCVSVCVCVCVCWAAETKSIVAFVHIKRTTMKNTTETVERGAAKGVCNARKYSGLGDFAFNRRSARGTPSSLSNLD